jgi:hypothetical protein
MTRLALAVVVGVVVSVSSVAAQVGTEPTAWAPEHREFANQLGNLAVAGQAAGATWDAVKAWRAGDHRVAFRYGCSLGLAMATTETLKRLTHEMRPDGSDDLSSPSGHSAAGAALSGASGAYSGWSWSFSVPIAVFAGLSRANANKHHLWNKKLASDIPFGWGVGAASQALCSALIRH